MKHFNWLLALILVPTTVSAATFWGGENYVLEAPLGDNLYLAGETLNLEETVNGDLNAATGRATITGDVKQDLHLAAGEIHLSGAVGDDLRVAGGTVYSSSSVGGEAIILGGEVILYDGFNVSGETWIFAGDVELNGDLSGDVQIYADRAVVRGDITGNVKITATEINFQSRVNGNAYLSAQDLEIGNQASFGSDLNYWQPEGELYLGDTEVKGRTIYDESLAVTPPQIDGEAVSKTIGMAVAAIFGFAFLSAILSIAMLALIGSRLFKEGAQIARKKFWLQMLTGFLYIILTPIVIFVFFVTMVGIPIAVTLLCIYLLSFLFVNCFTSLVVTYWLQDQYKKKWHPVMIILIAVGIYVLLKLIGLVPLIGTLAVLVLHLVTLGALGTALLSHWRK